MNATKVYLDIQCVAT